MSEKEIKNVEEIRKEIAIERLRQAPPHIKISFGMSKGEFMERDELINNVKENTEIGKNIVETQMAYLKAFKSGLVSGG